MTNNEHVANNDDDVFKQVEELTLLLAYLTSWEEDSAPESVRRVWKGYDFDVLRSLERSGYINGGRKAKSLVLTPEGVARTEALRRRCGK